MCRWVGDCLFLSLSVFFHVSYKEYKKAIISFILITFGEMNRGIVCYFVFNMISFVSKDGRDNGNDAFFFFVCSLKLTSTISALIHLHLHLSLLLSLQTFQSLVV